jgi:hypothetical protein
MGLLHIWQAVSALRQQSSLSDAASTKTERRHGEVKGGADVFRPSRLKTAFRPPYGSGFARLPSHRYCGLPRALNFWIPFQHPGAPPD